jgi:hypothetical protein
VTDGPEQFDIDPLFWRVTVSILLLQAAVFFGWAIFLVLR